MELRTARFWSLNFRVLWRMLYREFTGRILEVILYKGGFLLF